jgi:hypothetical protein
MRRSRHLRLLADALGALGALPALPPHEPRPIDPANQHARGGRRRRGGGAYTHVHGPSTRPISTRPGGPSCSAHHRRCGATCVGAYQWGVSWPSAGLKNGRCSTSSFESIEPLSRWLSLFPRVRFAHLLFSRLDNGFPTRPSARNTPPPHTRQQQRGPYRTYTVAPRRAAEHLLLGLEHSGSWRSFMAADGRTLRRR